MARVVVGGDGANFAFGLHQSKLIEEFVHVADFGGPTRSLGLPVVVPMMAVVLQHRAAAGDVIDDGVESLRRKRRQVLVGEIAGRFARAGVKMNSAAARLGAWNVNIASVLLQHPGSRPVD